MRGYGGMMGRLAFRSEWHQGHGTGIERTAIHWSAGTLRALVLNRTGNAEEEGEIGKVGWR